MLFSLHNFWQGIGRGIPRFRLMHRLLGSLALFSCVLVSAASASGAEVTLTWNPNIDPDIAGYNVYWGTSSRSYDFYGDAGNETSCTVTNLEGGRRYFFAATARDLSGNESGFSDEVSIYLPVETTDTETPPASEPVYEGDLVSVSVTVENQATDAETTTVSLYDQTGGVPIGSQSVSVNAGDSTIVSFTWDTAGASPGRHIPKAEASVVPGETDTADNSMPTTITIIEQPAGPVIYVSDITIELRKKGRRYQARAYVTIVDENGTPVKEAEVIGDWNLNGSFLNLASNPTDGQGTAMLDSDKVKAQSGDIFTVTITNVVKDGYTYVQLATETPAIR